MHVTPNPNSTPTMLAQSMALGFNEANDQKHWRALLITGKNPHCRFISRTGLIDLNYYPAQKRWGVTFSRVTCGFVDYLNAVTRALFVALSTLAKAGWLVDCPASMTALEVRFVWDADAKICYVEYVERDTPEDNQPSLPTL